MRLAANLVHVNKEAQNLIVDQGLLHIYVGFTSIDDMNPLNKECTIVFIRYMSETNDNAREYLRKLNLVDMQTGSKDILGKLVQI